MGVGGRDWGEGGAAGGASMRQRTASMLEDDYSWLCDRVLGRDKINFQLVLNLVFARIGFVGFHVKKKNR